MSGPCVHEIVDEGCNQERSEERLEKDGPKRNHEERMEVISHSAPPTKGSGKPKLKGKGGIRSNSPTVSYGGILNGVKGMSTMDANAETMKTGTKNMQNTTKMSRCKGRATIFYRKIVGTYQETPVMKLLRQSEENHLVFQIIEDFFGVYLRPTRVTLDEKTQCWQEKVRKLHHRNSSAEEGSTWGSGSAWGSTDDNSGEENAAMTGNDNWKRVPISIAKNIKNAIFKKTEETMRPITTTELVEGIAQTRHMHQKGDENGAAINGNLNNDLNGNRTGKPNPPNCVSADAHHSDSCGESEREYGKPGQSDGFVFLPQLYSVNPDSRIKNACGWYNHVYHLERPVNHWTQPDVLPNDIFSKNYTGANFLLETPQHEIDAVAWEDGNSGSIGVNGSLGGNFKGKVVDPSMLCARVNSSANNSKVHNPALNKLRHAVIQQSKYVTDVNPHSLESDENYPGSTLKAKSERLSCTKEMFLKVKSLRSILTFFKLFSSLLWYQEKKIAKILVIGGSVGIMGWLINTGLHISDYVTREHGAIHIPICILCYLTNLATFYYGILEVYFLNDGNSIIGNILKVYCYQWDILLEKVTQKWDASGRSGKKISISRQDDNSKEDLTSLGGMSSNSGVGLHEALYKNPNYVQGIPVSKPISCENSIVEALVELDETDTTLRDALLFENSKYNESNQQIGSMLVKKSAMYSTYFSRPHHAMKESNHPNYQRPTSNAVKSFTSYLISSTTTREKNLETLYAARRKKGTFPLIAFGWCWVMVAMSIHLSNFSDPGVIKVDDPKFYPFTIPLDKETGKRMYEPGEVLQGEKREKYGEIQEKQHQDIAALTGLKDIPFSREGHVYYPLYSQYCSFDDWVVIGRHHHCPWIANCVGFKNFKYYICFLIWLFILALIGIYLNLQAICLYIMHDMLLANGGILGNGIANGGTTEYSIRNGTTENSIMGNGIANGSENLIRHIDYSDEAETDVNACLTRKKSELEVENTIDVEAKSKAANVDEADPKATNVASYGATTNTITTTNTNRKNTNSNKKSTYTNNNKKNTELCNQQSRFPETRILFCQIRYHPETELLDYDCNPTMDPSGNNSVGSKWCGPNSKMTHYFLSFFFRTRSDFRIYACMVSLLWYCFCVYFVRMVGQYQAEMFIDGRILGSRTYEHLVAPPEHNTLYKNTCRYLGDNPFLWLLPIPGTGSPNSGITHAANPHWFDGL